MGESIDHRPLEGTKVVELSTMVAAGSCDRMLADWGAEVTRMESTGGDMFRSFPRTSFVPCTTDEGLLFDNLDTGRRGITLNLKTLGRMDTIHRLLADVDIFLTNTRPKVLERLGLNHVSLKEVYPKLVMADVNGFEEKGPKKDSPGFNTVAFWAGSGFNADMTVDGPGSYPVYGSAGPGDIVTAIGLYYVITAALYKRSQTGLGDHVSSSLRGIALWCFHIMAVAAEKRYGYTCPKTHENSASTGAPFRIKDSEQAMITILQIEKQWPILCNALGVPGLGTDPRYNTAIKQKDPEVRRYLMRRFEETYKTKTASEWCRILTDVDIVNDRFAHYKDMETSEQAWANEYIYEVTCSNDKKSIFVRLAVRSKKVGIPQWKRGPMLGEHTEEVLREYGYTDEQTEEVKEEEVAVQSDVSGYPCLDQSFTLPDGMIGFSDGGQS